VRVTTRTGLLSPTAAVARGHRRAALCVCTVLQPPPARPPRVDATGPRPPPLCAGGLQQAIVTKNTNTQSSAPPPAARPPPTHPSRPRPSASLPPPAAASPVGPSSFSHGDQKRVGGLRVENLPAQSELRARSSVLPSPRPPAALPRGRKSGSTGPPPQRGAKFAEWLFRERID
jgi:hypothetical protein